MARVTTSRSAATLRARLGRRLVIGACAAFGATHAFALPFSGTPGPDILVGPISNDVFRGFAGDDRLVGDFFALTAEDLTIPCRAGAGAESAPVDGASGQTADLANDLFDDGPGDDVIIGDAGLAFDFDEFQIFAASGTGARFGGRGGDFNTARCFSDSNAFFAGEDSVIGGPGNDLFIGDAFHANTQPDDLNLDAGAGSAGMGRLVFFPYGPGGDGGSNNSLQAFNDVADFSATLGRKTLIGDAHATAPDDASDRLVASAGAGAAGGGNGGHVNSVSAFNDELRGGLGPHRIIGDDYRRGGTGDLLFVAIAGAGGAGADGGAGGNDNILRAFSDHLVGGGFFDLIAGDVFIDGAPTDDLKFEVYSGAAPPGGGAGGVGNALSAFNDRIIGGGGPDTLIGEGDHLRDREAIRILVGVGGGNMAEAFSDIIDGGVGNDVIYGDFRFAPNICEIDQLEVSVAAGGAARLFADRISGGPGVDRIHGGYGADDMTGGPQRDRFLYFGPDLGDVGAGVPVDVITDFLAAPFGDSIDLQPLLLCLGFDPGDDPNDWLLVSGTTLQIDLNGPSGGPNFVPFIQANGLLGKTVNALVAGPPVLRNLLVP